MINLFRFGKPFNTESTVKVIPPCAETMPSNFGATISTNISFLYEYKLQKDNIIFGLGENLHGINKRGNKYVSYCSDDPNHTENKESLYGAHNFLIVYSPSEPVNNSFALFFDYPGEILFDVGFTEENKLVVSTKRKSIDLYLITADKSDSNILVSITTQFRSLIGQSYVPPLWAFGFQQSRWGYQNEKDITTVYEQYKKAGIPLDAIYLDIDYMKDFKDFTVDSERFPDLEVFAKNMKDNGIHLVPIIDAGVKIEDGYDVYEEGVSKDFFCVKEDGSVFTAAVWPGITHFPDFLNPAAREWFGNLYEKLLSKGIDGFWNDMNEPAIFYTPDAVENAFKKIKEYEGKNIGIHDFFNFRDTTNVCNLRSDYKSFYHKVPTELAGDYCSESNQSGVRATVNEKSGDSLKNQYTMVCHDDIHNLYGYNMTRSASESIEKLEKEKRVLLFSRASCIGMHRYGGIWTGDNQSWWSHLELNIKMLPSVNMCGFIYSGADTGGFGSNCSRELLLRWCQFSIFAPLFRNHAAAGTRNQELYNYENVDDFKTAIMFRYALLPYIYSEFLKAALENKLYFSPLSFEYSNDIRALEVEDQLLVGDSIMCAPVYEQNARGRYVYLPEDMGLVRITPLTDFSSLETLPVLPYKKGSYWIDIAQNEFVFFIRKDKAIPFCNLKKSNIATKDIDIKKVSLLGFKVNEERLLYTQYLDDGISKITEKSVEKRTLYL